MRKLNVPQRSFRRSLVSTLSLSLLLLPRMSFAQDSQDGTDSPSPLVFPAPTPTGVIGQEDAGAMAEIAAHLQAVSAAGWQDLEATGTVTFPDGDTHSASLYLLGSSQSRLDIVMDSGTRSLRLQGSGGTFQDDRGSQGTLPPATNRAGIVAFPRLWVDAATSANLSLYDQGIYSGVGQTLHRITIEYQLFPGAYTSGDQTVATDLYFDPNTHLLVYSVDSLTLGGLVAQSFTRITSYGAYQQFNGTLIPTTIEQTMNGQVEWTLLLGQITTNTNPAPSTFSF